MKRTIFILTALLLSFQLSAQNRLKLTSVVIDPGHGGKDCGAVSKDKQHQEKFYTLDISKRLARKIAGNCEGVSVSMTRSTDCFVSLQDRAFLANKANAQLFISIHINSTVRTTPNGFSVHVLGQSSNKDRDLFAYNMDVCKRENSVIMLEDDYSTKYEGFDPNDTESYIFMTLMQNANLEQSLKFADVVKSKLHGGPIYADRGIWQNPFYVLWKTSMPAVLVELGFISNDSDLASLRRESSREEIADRLFKAFVEYKESYDSTISIDREKPAVSDSPAPIGTTKSDSSPAPAQTAKPDSAPAPAQTLTAPDSLPAQATQQSGSVQEEKSEAKEMFGVQVLVSSNVQKSSNPVFMGYEPKVFKVGNLNKYVIAVSDDLQQVKSALQKIRLKTPDAFIVRIGEDGPSRVR